MFHKGAPEAAVPCPKASCSRPKGRIQRENRMAEKEKTENAPKAGFFWDDLGKLSMIRGMCFLSFLMAA